MQGKSLGAAGCEPVRAGPQVATLTPTSATSARQPRSHPASPGLSETPIPPSGAAFSPNERVTPGAVRAVLPVAGLWLCGPATNIGDRAVGWQGGAGGAGRPRRAPVTGPRPPTGRPSRPGRASGAGSDCPLGRIAGRHWPPPLRAQCTFQSQEGLGRPRPAGWPGSKQRAFPFLYFPSPAVSLRPTLAPTQLPSRLQIANDDRERGRLSRPLLRSGISLSEPARNPQRENSKTGNHARCSARGGLVAARWAREPWRPRSRG